MDNQEKVVKAISNIRPDTEYTFNDEITTEEHFNTIRWKTGVDGNTSISTTVNPHPELTWSAVSAEMDRLQADYDSQDYARNRKAEYPDIYDYIDGVVKSDQAQIDKYIADSQAVKDKYPKGA